MNLEENESLTSPLGISFLHIVIQILLFAIEIKAMHSDYS